MNAKGSFSHEHPMPEWRWMVYHPILTKVRDMSVLRADCESQDEDEDSSGDGIIQSMVDPCEPNGSVQDT